MTGEGRVHVISKQSNAEHCDVKGGCGQISGDVSEHVRPVWTDLASSSRNQNHFLYFLCLVVTQYRFPLSLSLVVVTSQQSDELVGILIERGFNEINL